MANPTPRKDLLPRPGLGNVGSYQVSGRPYLTGSTVTGSQEFHAEFPLVAKRVKVQVYDGATNDHIRVHFNSIADGNVENGHHWWHVKDGDPLDLDVKCKEVFVTHDKGASVTFHVYAELTNIPTGSMYHLTGSGLTD